MFVSAGSREGGGMTAVIQHPTMMKSLGPNFIPGSNPTWGFEPVRLSLPNLHKGPVLDALLTEGSRFLCCETTE